jgi:hypothetical protein
MTQYVLQTIIDTKQLIKSYEVTPEEPIRTDVPPEREQLVITDTDKFNNAVATYMQYGLTAHFTISGGDITWTIPG